MRPTLTAMENFDWIHLPNLEIRTGILGIAEVRDGPSSDPLIVRVAPGTYRPCLGLNRDEEQAVGAFRLVSEVALGGWRHRVSAADLERGGLAGRIATDLASVCCYDHEQLESLRASQGSDYTGWAESFYDTMDWPYGFSAFGGDTRSNVFYARGREEPGPFPISEVLRDGSPVGIEVIFDGVESAQVREGEELALRWISRGTEATQPVAP